MAFELLSHYKSINCHSLYYIRQAGICCPPTAMSPMLSSVAYYLLTRSPGVVNQTCSQPSYILSPLTNWLSVHYNLWVIFLHQATKYDSCLCIKSYFTSRESYNLLPATCSYIHTSYNSHEPV